MQIRLVHTDQFYPANRCATCGQRFTPEAVLALAYSQAGIALGTLCDECVQAGRDELSRRAQGYAAQLRQHADALERMTHEELKVLAPAPW
jgi:hydrogenase maturation factor HypF (carbamoyltransferase family)